MRLGICVPDFLKSLLRPLYYRATSFAQRNITRRPKTKLVLHQYWRQPWDGLNLPRAYLDSEATAPRSKFLTRIVRKFTAQDSKILEIGCGVGRNLNYLFKAGYRRLEGIEISEISTQVLQRSYPEMAAQTKIHNAPVEDVITHFGDNEFDLVYTMAVLAFIHRDSEWAFKEIARVTKDLLITIEDEKGISWRHFPRNYKLIFESLGMRQIEEMNCSGINGLGASYVARIFRKKEQNLLTQNWHNFT
jgi:SAM-dependent methyltransferase